MAYLSLLNSSQIILARRSLFCRLCNVYFFGIKLGMILTWIFCLKINEIHQPSYDKTSVLGRQADAALQLVLDAVSKIYSSNTRILESATQKDLLKGNDDVTLPTKADLKMGKQLTKKFKSIRKRGPVGPTEVGTLIWKASNFTFCPL